MVHRYTGIQDPSGVMARRGLHIGPWQHRFANVYSNSAPTAQRVQASAPSPSETGGDVTLHTQYRGLHDRQPGPPSRAEVLRGLEHILVPKKRRIS